MNLRPEQQLQLFLIENDYPHTDIPYILKYCPQLLQQFTVEEIAIAALTDIKSFEPRKCTLAIRPFVLNAMRAEIGKDGQIGVDVEEAISIFCQDTIIESVAGLIDDRKALLKDG